ncbi:hypothetical protein J6590_106884 [Homalodisca vitripennis]|nr:hypothetical protein J6590_106884 [Homalodisca vitripennis]
MSDNIVNHPSELDRQLDVDLSDDDWSDVSSIFSDDTDVDPTYRPSISDSYDEEMPFNQLSTSRGNAAARPTPDNDQPASGLSAVQRDLRTRDVTPAVARPSADRAVSEPQVSGDVAGQVPPPLYSTHLMPEPRTAGDGEEGEGGSRNPQTAGKADRFSYRISPSPFN